MDNSFQNSVKWNTSIMEQIILRSDISAAILMKVGYNPVDTLVVVIRTMCTRLANNVTLNFLRPSSVVSVNIF